MTINTQIQLLLIENDLGDKLLIENFLQDATAAHPALPGFHLTHLSNLTNALEYLLQDNPVDIILLDLQFPDSTGLDTFTAIAQLTSNIPVVILTDFQDLQLAGQAMQAGAQDYLDKNQLDAHLLDRAIHYAIERHQLRRDLALKAQALEASEVRLRTLIEKNADAILMLTADGAVQYANPAAEKMFGKSSEELRVHPFDFPLIRNKSTELSIISDQTHRTVEMRLTDIEWQNKPAFIATLRDTTERTHTEQALKISEAKYRTLAEQSLQGIAIIQENKIVFANPALSNITGYSTEELMSIDLTSFNDSVYAEDRPMINQLWQNRFQPTSSPLLLEFRFIDKNNKTHWLAMQTAPIQNIEQPATLLIILDITQRKQAEEALKQEHTLLAQRVDERTAELHQSNRHLTQALRVKDEFLASMSHELRTPLNAILGMSEILHEGVYGSLNEQQLNSVNIVQESGHHLLALINDILDVSKIEADKLQLNLSAVQVESACQASLRFVQRAAERKDISISLELDDPKIVIQADERRLKQILVNLLSNAVKFTSAGGSIGLKVTTNRPKRLITFIVWDTGIGIAPNDLNKIFMPFVQLDSRLAREYEGTGLGLALVFLLTELHGGTISAESSVGQGSRFTVSLPWHNVEPNAPVLPSLQPTVDEPAPPAGHQPLILLAEDNRTNVEVMSSYLSAKGYRIVTVSDGLDAVAYAKKLQPDLILMDIHMPELDGLEATRRIRKTQGLGTVPIIALTALAMPGDKERCLAAGVDDYLSKPVSLRRLTETIKDKLRPSQQPT